MTYGEALDLLYHTKHSKRNTQGSQALRQTLSETTAALLTLSQCVCCHGHDMGIHLHTPPLRHGHEQPRKPKHLGRKTSRKSVHQTPIAQVPPLHNGATILAS